MIKRRKVAAFCDEPTGNNKKICQNCYENNCLTKLVEYKQDPLHYMLCPYCGNIVSKDRLRFESVTEPLGSLVGKKPTFEVAEKRRSRSRVNRSSYEPTEEEVPLLNNKKDIELESLLKEHNGILVSVTDDNTDMGDEEY